MKFDEATLWYMYQGEALPPGVNAGRWSAMLKQIKSIEIEVIDET